MSRNPYRLEEVPRSHRAETTPRRWPLLVGVAIVSALLAAVTTWYVLTRHGLPPPVTSSLTVVQAETPGPAPGLDEPHHPQLNQQGD